MIIGLFKYRIDVFLNQQKYNPAELIFIEGVFLHQYVSIIHQIEGLKIHHNGLKILLVNKKRSFPLGVIFIFYRYLLLSRLRQIIPHISYLYTDHFLRQQMTFMIKWPLWSLKISTYPTVFALAQFNIRVPLHQWICNKKMRVHIMLNYTLPFNIHMSFLRDPARYWKWNICCYTNLIIVP